MVPSDLSAGNAARGPQHPIRTAEKEHEVFVRVVFVCFRVKTELESACLWVCCLHSGWSIFSNEASAALQQTNTHMDGGMQTVQCTHKDCTGYKRTVSNTTTPQHR